MTKDPLTTGRIQDAMRQDQKETRTAVEGVDDLEPYRQLIELQKQMIKLVRRHEETKRECTALRAQLLEEMAELRRPRWSLLPSISRLAAEWLKSLAVSWKSRWENRPPSNGSLLPRNPLLKT